MIWLFYGNMSKNLILEIAHVNKPDLYYIAINYMIIYIPEAFEVRISPRWRDLGDTIVQSTGCSFILVFTHP